MSQKRYAYLIGANGPEIKGERLRYAEHDIVRLADALTGPHCQFPHPCSVIADSRKDGLTDLNRYINECQPTDVLLLHFSGHAGFDGSLYLICNDTDVDDLVSS